MRMQILYDLITLNFVTTNGIYPDTLPHMVGGVWLEALGSWLLDLGPLNMLPLSVPEDCSSV